MSFSQDEFQLKAFARNILIRNPPSDESRLLHPDRLILHHHHQQLVIFQALRNRYPKLSERMSSNFKFLCQQYQSQNSCQEAVLEEYGQSFPKFLAEIFGQESGFVHLAHLENQIYQLQQQEEPALVLKVDQIQSLIEQGLIAELRLYLNPSLIMISSPGNLWDYWQNTEVTWEPTPQDLFLWLSHGELKLQVFPLFLARALDQVSKGSWTIEDLWQSIVEPYGFEALQAWMQNGLEYGWLLAAK